MSPRPKTPPREPPQHECPREGCHNMIPKIMFACRDHWFELPPDLRAEIVTKWQIYRAAFKTNDLLRVGEAAQDLLEVQSAAEAFWQVGI